MDRHGSYYTTINSDCIEFCPYPGRQSSFISGHYELLSNKQHKIGQITLSSIHYDKECIDPTTNHSIQRMPHAIPIDEYCTTTNENQEHFCTRHVDLNNLLTHPLPTFGQIPTQLTSEQRAQQPTAQPYVLSNISLCPQHQITMPALLDAKWSPYTIPIYSSKQTSCNSTDSSLSPPTTKTTSNETLNPIHRAGLIAAACEDGSIRLYEHCDDTQQLIPHSAILVSSSALCLYIDWSNKQRYSWNKHLYSNLIAQYDGSSESTQPSTMWSQDDIDTYMNLWSQLDKQQSSTQPCATENNTADQHAPSVISIDDESLSKNENGTPECPQGYVLDPALHAFVSTKASLCVSKDNHPTLVPHYCSTTAIPDPAFSHLDQSDDYDKYPDDEDAYHKGKTFNSIFTVCSLSDGSVAVCDIIPTTRQHTDIPLNNPSHSQFVTKSDHPSSIESDADDVHPPVFNLHMTHHWKAHNAECWVAVSDGFNPNIVYTGADDHLLKVWDIRMIHNVNYEMYMQGLLPEDPPEVAPLERQTCSHCHHAFPTRLPQTSYYHGYGALMNQCQSHLRGNQDNTKSCGTIPCICSIPAELRSQHQSLATQHVRLNIPHLTTNQHFHPDFIPQQDAYPLLTSTAHHGGVIDIQSHPYNPYLLLTGSYDNHIRLFDKRHLKQPISELDTQGGAWRIKFHHNPIFADQFLLVNMYQGCRYVKIDNMQLALQAVSPYEEQKKGGRIVMGSVQDAHIPSEWPRWEGPQSSDSTLHHIPHHAGYSSLYTAMTEQNDIETLSREGDFIRQPSAAQTQITSTYPAMQTYMNEYSTLFSQDNAENNNEAAGTSTEESNLALRWVQDTPYDQHGDKTIVYGGDICYASDISYQTVVNTDRVENHSSVNNLAVTCSFYNKRVDLLSLTSSSTTPDAQ